PGGEDRLNRVIARFDYGWPGSSARSADTQLGLGPSVDPAGATFYTGALIPEFQNDLFFVSGGYRSLVRLRLDPQSRRRVVGIERMMEQKLGRLGAVTAGPDGALYLSTANWGTSDARAGDDRILRISRRQ